MTADWYWVGLFLLGGYHGLNPGMGWLYAVARGLQAGSRRALLLTFVPVTLGHGLSVGLVALLLWLLHGSLPHSAIRVGAGLLLLGFGLMRLLRSRHPRYGGMQVALWEIGLWSFLMASAHGAGIMLIPILMGVGGDAASAHHASALSTHTARSFTPSPEVLWSLGIGLHTLGFLAVMVGIALLTYEKLGLALLRRAWFNLDLLWALALLVAGALTLLL